MLDVMIVGQGIAGALLAIECIRSGRRVLVIDDDDQGASTKIAAGIMNPLIGPRLSPAKADVNAIMAYYQALELELGGSFLNQHRLVRFLSTSMELEAMTKRLADLNMSNIIQPTQEWGHVCNVGKTQFEIPVVGQINTLALLEGVGRYVDRRAQKVTGKLQYSDIQLNETGVKWQGYSAKHLVFCEGAKGDGNPFFPELRFKNAWGHIIELDSEHLPTTTILNHGKWLCPMGDKGGTGHFRYGATSYWDPSDAQERASEKSITESVSNFLTVPFSIKKLIHGCRPCLINQQPFAGFSERYPQLATINGLAGQGMLMAPTLAQSLSHKMHG